MIKAFFFVFLFFCVQGLLLGPTDDEAYYWVLAQKPHWAFAYHPPAVSWAIRFFESIFSDQFAYRIGSAFLMAIFFSLSHFWLKGKGKSLFSFAGIFGVGWMMVPDLPMLVGWILALMGVSQLSQGSRKFRDEVVLFLGVSLVFLSKYSAPLLLISILWALRDQSFQFSHRWRTAGVCLAGAVVGLIPSLIYFYESGLGAILYQFGSRHGGLEISFRRWGLFILSQLILVGPIIVLIWGILKETWKTQRLLWIFAWPAGVYLIQPLFSEFKPHWAFLFWLPLFFVWIRHFGAVSRIQAFWGGTVFTLMTLGVHFPVIAWAEGWLSSKESNSLHDISNDLHGWEHLPEALKELEENGSVRPDIVILASRYQTAAQAAFALQDPNRVTRNPVPLREFSDWKESPAVDGRGEGWHRLREEVLYIADERYSEPPRYAEARCEKLKTIEPIRFGVRGKKIFIWKCMPQSEPA